MNALSNEELAELRAQHSGSATAESLTIVQLLDEIDELDDALDNSEDEVDQLRARLTRMRERYQPHAVSGSVSQLPTGRWRLRWRDTDGTQRSATFNRRRHAELFLDEAIRRARDGGR